MGIRLVSTGPADGELPGAEPGHHPWDERRGPGPDRAGQGRRNVGRDSRTADVHVSRLRHKLGPVYGQCLVTEHRAGYRFRPLPAVLPR